MDGLMMDYQLNVPALLRRADELYGESEIASRLPDKSWHSYSYADFVSRTKRLVVGLKKLGLEDGDRALAGVRLRRGCGDRGLRVTGRHAPGRPQRERAGELHPGERVRERVGDGLVGADLLPELLA